MIKNNFDQKKYWRIIGILIIITIIIAICVHGLPEINNNVTLVVEIFVGIIIALVVYGITQKSEREIKQKINSIFNIVHESEDFRKKRENIAKTSFLNVFSNIESTVKIIIELIKYNQENHNGSKKNIKKILDLKYDHIKKQIKENLEESYIISGALFEMPNIKKFKKLVDMCKKFSNIDDNEEGKINTWKAILNKISTYKDELEKDLGIFEHYGRANIYQDDESTEFEKALKISRIPEIQSYVKKAKITVSADRTVFPQNSTIYVRAEVGEILENKEIVIKIFDSKKKLLIHDIINPKKSEKRLDDSNIFQTSLKMDGERWQIGEYYRVRATYDESFSEDVFAINERTPIILVDKAVYMRGDKMTITVIDPDADKDSKKIETVGDRVDSKLTIQSKSGKIDGYGLKETGLSTGIFQGMVRFLGAEKDGTIIPQRFGKNVIDKVQGTGIEDGFIGCSVGEEIVITYVNSANIERHGVFIVSSVDQKFLREQIYRLPKSQDESETNNF